MVALGAEMIDVGVIAIHVFKKGGDVKMTEVEAASAVIGCCFWYDGSGSEVSGAMTIDCGETVTDVYPVISAFGSPVTGDVAFGLTSVYKVEDEGTVAVEATVGKYGYANHDATFGATHIIFEAVSAGSMEEVVKVSGCKTKAGKPFSTGNVWVKVTSYVEGPAKATVDVEIDCTSGVYTTVFGVGETTYETRAVTEPGVVV